MKEILKKNGNLFTGIAVLVILVGGVSLVNNKDTWWITSLVILTLGILFFLIKSAKVVLKSLVSILATVYLASLAFKVGTTFDASGQGGVGWAMSIMALFFLCLTISYFWQSLGSRWTAAGLAVITNFVLGFAIVVLSSMLWLATIVSFVVSLGLFILIYRFSPNSRFKKSEMPTSILELELFQKLSENLAKDGWNAQLVEKTESMLVWKDKIYLVHPVLMDGPFGLYGRKTDKLGYHGKSISAWLSNTENNLPAILSGNQVLTVILDVENKNGKTAKIVSVKGTDSLLDSPFAILPGREIFNLNRSLAQALEKEFGKNIVPAKAKTIEKLNSKNNSKSAQD